MICIFGVLLTRNGLRIKNEMLNWLKPIFDVFVVEQDPPGKLVEYPAIKKALECSIEMNEPVLYLHTKGAANNHTLQAKVRRFWQYEFTNIEHLNNMYNIAKNYEGGLVLCPFTGKTKATWYNAFIVNSIAAKIALATLKTPDKCDRWYYETHVFESNDIKVLGTRSNSCNTSEDMINFFKHIKV